MTDKGCKHEPCICDHCKDPNGDADWCPLCEIDRLKVRIGELEYELFLSGSFSVDETGFCSRNIKMGDTPIDEWVPPEVDKK